MVANGSWTPRCLFSFQNTKQSVCWSDRNINTKQNIIKRKQDKTKKALQNNDFRTLVIFCCWSVERVQLTEAKNFIFWRLIESLIHMLFDQHFIFPILLTHFTWNFIQSISTYYKFHMECGMCLRFGQCLWVFDLLCLIACF